MIKKSLSMYRKHFLNDYNLKSQSFKYLSLLTIGSMVLLFVLFVMLFEFGLVFKSFNHNIILFQVILVFGFILHQKLSYMFIKKVHPIPYETKHIEIMHLIFFLTVSFTVQTFMLFYAYEKMVDPTIFLIVLIFSSLCIIVSLAITLLMSELEIYAKLFSMVVIIVLFHIVSMRYLAFDPIKTYVYGFILAFVFYYVLIEVKTTFDQKNRIKLPRNAMYMAVGLLVFFTSALQFKSYTDYFYNDIKVKARLNLFGGLTQNDFLDDNYEHAFTFDSKYTYIQRGDSLAIYDQKTFVRMLYLPINYHILASKDVLMIAHLTEVQMGQNIELPFVYDFYQLDDDFNLIQLYRLHMKYPVYGVFIHENHKFFVSPFFLSQYDEETYIKLHNVLPTGQLDTQYEVGPIFKDGLLHGFGYTDGIHEIMFSSNQYSLRTPYLEVIGDRLLGSFSWRGTYEHFALLDPSNFDVIDVFGLPQSGFSYFKTDDYQFVEFRNTLSIYNEKGNLLETFDITKYSVFSSNDQIFLNHLEYDITHLEKGISISDTLYLLNIDHPIVYSITSNQVSKNIWFTLGIFMIFLCMDQKKNMNEKKSKED